MSLACDYSQAVFSLYDAYAIGAVLDVGGAWLLASGLFCTPIEAYRRSEPRYNYSVPQIVGMARDWADGRLGAAALGAGFATQGIAYLVSVAGVHAATGGGQLITAALLMAAAAAAIWLPRRKVRRSLARSRALEVMVAGRGHDAIALSQLGQELGYDGLDGETHAAYVKRVFGLTVLQPDAKSLLLAVGAGRPLG